MPRNSLWTSDEQVQFLRARIPLHQSAQGNGKLPQFWEEFFNKSFVQFLDSDVEPPQGQPAIRVVSSHSVIWNADTYGAFTETEAMVQQPLGPSRWQSYGEEKYA